MHRAVLHHPTKRLVPRRKEPRRRHHLDLDGGHPGGPILAHLVVAPNLEALGRQVVAPEEPFGVEADAACQARHEQLGGGRAEVLSPGVPGLIDRDAVATDPDLEPVVPLVPHRDGHLRSLLR